jgi:uncharacterized protein with HEPN domain
MSDRPVDLLIEDILERIRRIGRYTRGLDHDAFVQDEKTVDNRIVHDYFNVDLDLVWQIVRNELPRLESELARLKRRDEPGAA